MSTPRPVKKALPISEPRRLRAALAGLDTRERRIVELRHGIGEARPQTLAQIGRRFGISGERVRQIETRALRRLAVHNGGTAVQVRAAKRTGHPKLSLPSHALQAWTLLFLRLAPAYGYQLEKRLHHPGVHLAPGRLYRLLRELEHTGLVRSDWAESDVGPERRVYKLTRKGSRQLKDDAQTLKRLFETLTLFFEHYAQTSTPRS